MSTMTTNDYNLDFNICGTYIIYLHYIAMIE